MLIFCVFFKWAKSSYPSKNNHINNFLNLLSLILSLIYPTFGIECLMELQTGLNLLLVPTIILKGVTARIIFLLHLSRLITKASHNVNGSQKTNNLFQNIDRIEKSRS
jgi:hypothetical protein